MEQVEREKASSKPDNTPHNSDEDEFYDEQEIDGLIYNSCGQRVYTNFLKGDTDDDGLLDSEEVSVYLSYDDVQLENPYYYGRKYYHQMYSDPNNADTDRDGVWDDEDYEPRIPMTDDEKLVYEFFLNAESYEISFVLSINDNDEYNKNFGTLKMIKCVEIFRRHIDDRNLDEIRSEMISKGLMTDSSTQSLLMRIDQFLCGYTGDPATLMFAEYENYKNGTSFKKLMVEDWLRWTNPFKMAVLIWTFGVADLLVNNWAKYDYSTDYKLSLEQEKNLKVYSEEYTAANASEIYAEDYDHSYQISKNDLKHINNRHNPKIVSKQLSYMSEEDFIRKYVNRSFFNAEWTPETIEEAVNYGYNKAMANGVTSYSYIYDGERITIHIENGLVKTAYGDYKYTYEFFYELSKK